jgi:hypothetical protein
MTTASISEVRVVVRSMAKRGFSMGIYYFINQKNQKFYVDRALNPSLVTGEDQFYWTRMISLNHLMSKDNVPCYYCSTPPSFYGFWTSR